jgi:hypothetical protein
MTTEHISDPSAAAPSRAVREGQLAPVTCEACGCRLEAVGTDAVAWFHFGRISGRDARGDRVACIDAAHDAGGHAALAA